MQITVYSVIMTVLWSNLLIIIFSILQRDHHFIDICSVSGMMLLYMFCVFRMFVPIEFMWVKIIHSKHIFNALHNFLYSDLPFLKYDNICMKHMLITIWAVVSIFLLIRLVINYFQMNRNIAMLSCTEDEELDAIFTKINSKEKKPLKVKVAKSLGIDTPLGVGIIHKKILIPDRKYSKKDLFYIIKHEYMHHKNQDLFVQLLVNILCVIYWWNPFVYFLRRNIEHGFEVRCDQMVVRGMSNEDIADYLETLLTVFQLKKKNNKELKYVASMLGITKSNRDDIRNRFDTLLRESAFDYKTYGKQAAAVTMVAILILSYFFIIQPEILPTDNDIGNSPYVYEVEMSESYIMHYENDTYELITPNGEHVNIDAEMVQQMIKDGFQVTEVSGDKK